MKNIDLLCLGEPMVEFNQSGDGLFKQGFGGDTSNCAISAARQGAQTGYLTKLGNDQFGNLLMDLWHSEKVDTTCVKHDPHHPTGIYFVSHDEQGHHYTYYRKHSAASKLSPSDISTAEIANAKFLHVSGISQAISASAADAVMAAIEIANNNNTLVSYDTNLRLALWPEDQARSVIHTAIKNCDVALPSYDDAKILTQLDAPDDIVDFYLKLGAGIVALKLGKKGAIVATPDERQMINSLAVNSIDANGAGDIFGGAFLAELINGKTPFEAGQYANLVAAISTTRPGAVNSTPTRREVQESNL